MPIKKKGKKKGKNQINVIKRDLQIKGEYQEYAKIIKLLGDRRVTIVLPDNKETLGIIPGRFRKRVWMKPTNIVLVSYREFQDNRFDIIHKYTDDESKKLFKMGEIPEFFVDDNANSEIGDTLGFEIEEEFNFDDI
jgi:translation initiation factor 1A